jgi:hypothetical protein
VSNSRGTLRAWLERHGPVWPVVRGVIALCAATGTLVMLGVGLSYGRPLTPYPFAVWLGISVLALAIVAFEWSRWFFIGLFLVVLALMLILVAEYGENVNRHEQLQDARSTEQVLVLYLSRGEHIAAASQLKSLAFSSAGTSALASQPSPPWGSAGDVSPATAALRWDLQRVFGQQLAPTWLIKNINADQARLTTALIAGRSTSLQSGVSIAGGAISLRWWSYFTTATTSLEHLCSIVGRPASQVPRWLCSGESMPTTVLSYAKHFTTGGATITTRSSSHRGTASRTRIAAQITPSQLEQALSPAVSAVSAAVNEVQSTTANQQNVAASDRALSNAFEMPPLSSVNISGDLSRGAGALVAYFEGASVNGSWWYASFNLGAWILLAVVALLLLRLLLLLNNRNGWGPIEVVFDAVDKDDKAQEHDLERLSKIRSYVVENVPEPAAAPGSNALTQITNLVAASSLGAPPWLRALANFVEWALLPPSGYRILVDFREPGGPSSKLEQQPLSGAGPGSTAQQGGGGTGGQETPSATVTEAGAVGSRAGGEAGTVGVSVHVPGREGSPDLREQDAAGTSTGLCVVMRIATRGRSRTLEVKTIAGSGIVSTEGGASTSRDQNLKSNDKDPSRKVEEEDDLLRSAGYWAAGWILSKCKLIPEWAIWPAPAGPSLGRFRTAQDAPAIDDPDPRSKRRVQAIDRCIEGLEGARAAAPRSGAVLTQLAEQYEFKNDFINALEVTLEVVRLYPRYYVVRYRAAVLLSMLVSSGTPPWSRMAASADGQALRILDLLDEIATGGKNTRAVTQSLRHAITPVSNRTPPPQNANLTAEISTLSAMQLRSGARLANSFVMFGMALRKDERRFWFSRLRHPFLIRHNLRSAMPSIAKVAGYGPNMANGDLPTGCRVRYFKRPALATVRSWAQSRNESAQVLYNLACYESLVLPPYSSLEDAGTQLNTAMSLLEQSQTHPYGDQIQASWMERDPDLRTLRIPYETPYVVRQRFKRLLALLRGGQSARVARQRSLTP